MCKEISSWKLVVNALFYLPERTPMPLDPQDKKYFWRYVLMAAEDLETEFKDIFLYTDKYSLENVLWNDNLYINIKDNSLYLDEGVSKDDIEVINEYLEPNIKNKLPDVFKSAYQRL